MSAPKTHQQIGVTTLRPIVFVALAIIASATCSQEPAAKPPTSNPADFQNLESIFSLISNDLPPESALTRFPNNQAELKSLAESYEMNAERGDRLAEFKIGAMYLKCVGVRQNFGNAVRWFTKAGGSDHPLAQLSQGMFCLKCRDDDSDDQARQSAIRAIGKMGPAAEQAVPMLEHEIRTHGSRAYVAVEALGPIGQRGVPTLIELLTGKDLTLRRCATEALANAGEAARAAIPALTAASKDEDPSLCRYAQNALAKLQQPQSSDSKTNRSPTNRSRSKNSNPKATQDELIAALKDASPSVRSTAATKLRNLRENGKPAVPALILALQDCDANVRENAAEALGWIGPGDEDAVPPLIKAMHDPSGEVRSNAARAFITSWPDPLRALSSLINALSDSAATLNASYAITELAKHGHSEEVLAAIQEYLQRADEQGKESALFALGNIGPPAGATVSAVKPLLASRDAGLRQAAAVALGKIGKAVDEAVQTLVADLHNDDLLVRADAARSLGEIGPAASAAVPELVALLSDRNSQAFDSFQKAAEQDNPEAQFRLAIMYRDGLGTQQDYEAAAKWFLAAATQHHPEAQRQFGILCRQGRGVPRSDALAESWYYKAAATDSVLSRLKDLPLNTAAYDAAMSPHKTGKSDNGAAENHPTLILAITSFEEGATLASHLQVRSDSTADRFLDIYDHSRRGGSPYPFKLNATEMDRLTSLLKKLPAGVVFAPIEQELVVSCLANGHWSTRRYDRENLPREMRDVLDIFEKKARADEGNEQQ